MQPTPTSQDSNNHIKSHLPLPSGVTLYYEIRGTGPPLLLIPGAHATGLIYESLAEALSPRFRVTLYDLRGFVRSDPNPNSNPSQNPRSNPQTIETHTGDALALIRHLSPTTPITVFSSSSTAPIALSLLHKCPQHIHKVILHEPLLFSLLPPAIFTAINRLFTSCIRNPKHPSIHAINRTILPLVQRPHGWARFTRTREHARFRELRLPSDFNLRWDVNEFLEVVEWGVDVEGLMKVGEAGDTRMDLPDGARVIGAAVESSAVESESGAG
ncbi:alpha/beta-hydrolase [Aspergillus heteromorphus CBS 117.55]|uniref:Alpha/beta-hydrolase n=1 Tax=Aspergillus heteromorphus CBS 117.55 TaxID=1448321 RepID=A0A317WPF3_9EURO|nr:alpha/beta-hydrolase [Aspergillus heteromorphus CBS 117.55]PWY86758.1 alpha/beta-hydrolase [Aspergillus heteromorphus CBS 117.55]